MLFFQDIGFTKEVPTRFKGEFCGPDKMTAQFSRDGLSCVRRILLLTGVYPIANTVCFDFPTTDDGDDDDNTDQYVNIPVSK